MRGSYRPLRVIALWLCVCAASAWAASGDHADIEPRKKQTLANLPGPMPIAKLEPAPHNECLCGGAVVGPDAPPVYRPLVASDLPPGLPPGLHASTHESGGADQLSVNAPTAPNRVYASPASGGAGAPVYRPLVVADLPPAPANQVLAGPTSGGPSPPVYRPLASSDLTGVAVAPTDNRLPYTPSTPGTIPYADGSVYQPITAGSTVQLLHGGTAPSFGAVNLAADVGGILPIANGGTASSTGDLVATNQLTAPLFRSTGTVTLNGASGANIQYNGTTYLALSSTAITVQNAPLVVAPRYVTYPGATLVAKDRYVLYDTNSGIGGSSLTLPSAPPDGTVIQIVNRGTGSTYQDISIARAGSDTIMDASTTSMSLPGYGANVVLIYNATNTRWQIANLRRVSLIYRWTAALANDYLQPGGTGGALSSAVAVLGRTGTIVTGLMRLQTRGASVGATHTVKLRTVNDVFGTAADLTNNFQASISSGSAGLSSTFNFLNSNTSLPGNWLTLQATTAITSPMDVMLDLWIL